MMTTDAACRPPSYNTCVSDVFILGIESSCDETAAAVVRSGEEVVSNVVYSQIATHQPYGGVVPELASREHLRAIVPVVRKALDDAGKTYETIDALAVTKGPGLAGALLVGVSYAKALAYALEKPLIGVNHLEGHIHAVLLEERQNGNRELQFPVLALVVSGGHTHLYLAERQDAAWTYHDVGHTRDDAAGEAFDKVAKLLELGYPGGPVIDFLAAHGNPAGGEISLCADQASRPQSAEPSCRRRAPHRFFLQRHQDRGPALCGNPRHAGRHRAAPARACRNRALLPASRSWPLCDPQTLDLVASFQRRRGERPGQQDACRPRESTTSRRCWSPVVWRQIPSCARRFERKRTEEGLPVYFPSRKLSTDNAAMIAAAAYPRFLAGEFAEPELSADAALRLRWSGFPDSARLRCRH